MNTQTLVIQFAKYPEVGSVKTRLIPLLTKHGSCQLHQNLVRYTAAQIRKTGFYQILAFNHLAEHHLISELGEGIPLLKQVGSNLGEKMENAFAWALKQAEQVILVGSDCPALTVEHYQLASQALLYHDHVFVPAEDGGYVLVGSRVQNSELFKNVSWGSAKVWDQTKSNLKGCSYTTMPMLWDVDRPEDFNRLRGFLPDLCEL